MLISSYSLKDIAKCSTITCENTHPSVFFWRGGGDLSNPYVSRDSRIYYRVIPPFITNKHIHPFEICNPKYQRYLNSVIDPITLPILQKISHNLQFNSSTEGSLSRCLFETAHSVSNSTHVVAIKFNFGVYNMILSIMVKFNKILRNVSWR